AFVALVAFVALSAAVAWSAFAALGTFPRALRLTCVPVMLWLRRRLPDSECFLIRLSPLTSLLPARAVPEAATTRARIATTIDADGLQRNTLFMGTPPRSGSHAAPSTPQVPIERTGRNPCLAPEADPTDGLCPV